MGTQAHVTVKLAIKLQQGWGDECTMAQIKKQAKDDCRSIVTRMIQESGNKELFSFDVDSVHITISEPVKRNDNGS